jgi:Na+/proline symporter
MAQRNDLTSIINGILLVFLIHIAAVGIIIFLGLILAYVINYPYISLAVYLYAGMGFSLIQLIYVIPIVLKLKQQQRWGMMKGVIIGAVLTALLNGGCWLLMSGVVRF